MAESVAHANQRRIEEFEEIQRIGLLSEKEISDLKKKRDEFEYKTRAVTKDLNCFLNYITFEDDFLKLIRCRRDKKKISDKKGSIERRIISNIKSLYDKATRFYPDNYDVCVNYFLFCKRVRYVETATVAVDRLLKLHPSKEHAWNLAAGWYAKGLKDYQKALNCLLKGIALHPDSQLLYKQAINIHLSQAQAAIAKDEGHGAKERAKKNCVEKLNSYLDVIFKKIDRFSFYFELLELLEIYDFAKEIKQQILNHIMAEYKDEPLVWHNIAQRCQRGLDGATTNADGPEERLSCCIAKYVEGIDKIPQNKKPHLWSLFLDYLIQCYEKTKVKKDHLNEHLLKAHDCRCLPEKYYSYWLALNKDDRDGEVLKKATEAYPRSEKWFELYLRYQILKHQPPEAIAVTFSQGREALGNRALNLWVTFIQYHVVMSSEDVVQSYFLRGIKESENISMALRPQYLEWLILSKGIQETRKAYMDLSSLRPFCKEVHLTMLNIESTYQNKDNMEAIHKTLSEQFPEDLDVWVGCMEFYNDIRWLDPKEQSDADKKKTYNKALCMLSGPSLKQFKEQYSHRIVTNTFK